MSAIATPYSRVRGDISLLARPCAPMPEDREAHSGQEFYRVQTSAGWRRYPRVSSILDGIGQPWLARWVARTEQGAFRAAAIEQLQVLSQSGTIPLSAAVSAMERLAPALESEKIRDRAADFGSKIHGLIENYLKQARLPDIGDISQELSYAWASWLAWWQQAGLVVIATERRVHCTVCGYGGTYDGLLQETGTGKVFLADWKSSKRLRDSYGLQVSAYAHATPERPDGAILVRIPHTPRGKVQERRLDCDDLVSNFAAFQSALTLYRWSRSAAGQDYGDDPEGTHGLPRATQYKEMSL